MAKRTRAITMTALISALATITLYIASVWPTGRIGIVALASVFSAAAVVEAGLASGIYVFVISSALGLLLIPDRSAVLLYICFFGYYPVVKCLVERIRNISLQWVLKLLIFNIAMIVVWFLLRALLFSFDTGEPATVVVFLGGNVIFAAFDYGFSKLIWFYKERISKNIRKR